VVDLVDVSERIYPVGRLDKASTGLLLLTNDGRIHHRLSHPSFDHEKEYDVTVARPISDGALKKMRGGMPLMGTRTRPARVTRLSARRFRIMLKEGKNRQIRRMVRKVGNQVTQLKRKRFAGITLGNLAAGKWRYLTPDEKKRLLNSL
jgi:23S rRNA pseudouridine2605 synthase/23S rRNA pseudouridine2604 synthase